MLVKGLEQAGPFVLTMKSAAGAAFEVLPQRQQRHQPLRQHRDRRRQCSIRCCRQESGQGGGKLLGLPGILGAVGADSQRQGRAGIHDRRQATNTTNVVLPIALGLPEKAAQVDFKRFYVGNDLLATVNALYDETAEWRNAWTADGGAAANGDTTSGEHVATERRRQGRRGRRTGRDRALSSTVGRHRHPPPHLYPL